MGFLKRLIAGALDDSGGSPPFSAKATWLQWPTIAWGSLHSVAGESYRQEELALVLRSLPSSSRLVTAQLVREPTNQYDRNAVRVEVGGHHVGYLPRELAPGAHALIDSLHRAERPATCRAEITGGVGSKSFLGITLHVANPWGTFDGGTPFLDGSRCHSITVTKEERYQAELEPCLADCGDRPVACELCMGDDGIVDVAFDGVTVGHLTPRMTERHGVTVAAVQEAGLLPSCWARLHRNEKGVIQVTLSLQAPGDG